MPIANQNIYPSVLRNINFLSAVFVVFSLPFTIKLNSFSIIIFVISSIAVSTHDKKRLIIPKPFYFLLLLYIIILFSFFLSASFKFWLHDIETKAALLVFPLGFIFSGYNFTKRKIEIILYSFAFATIACCLTAHILVLHRMFINGDSIAKSFEWYYSYVELVRPLRIDPIYLSVYVIFSISILLSQVVISKIKIITIINSLLIAYLVFFLFLLSSRIGIITFTIVILFHSAFYLWNQTKIVFFVTLIGVGMVLFLYIRSSDLAKERFSPLATDLRSIFSTEEPTDIYDNRTIIYRCAISIIASDLSLFGMGAGNDTKSLNKCYKSSGYDKLQDFDPHSDYFSFIIRNGIVGLIIFVAIIFTGFYKSIKERLFLLNVLSMLMIFVGIFESTFFRQKGVVFYTFFYCLLIIYSSYSTNDKSISAKYFA